MMMITHCTDDQKMLLIWIMMIGITTSASAAYAATARSATRTGSARAPRPGADRGHRQHLLGNHDSEPLGSHHVGAGRLRGHRHPAARHRHLH